jgi:hypothetical protein
MNDLTLIIKAINEQKGEALGMQAMLNSILRAMPMPQLAATLQEFDTDVEHARVVMLNSDQANEHMLRGLEHYVAAVAGLRY